VAIARALAQQPRLILADEPVASLDPTTADGVMALLKSIARSEGVAVLCSLHQVPFARAYADRIIGLSQGRVVLQSSADGFDDSAYSALYGAATVAVASQGRDDQQGSVHHGTLDPASAQA
jgi:phosphonate transport system ATP-binding protein